MEQVDVEKKIAAHYTQGNVTARIIEALGLQPNDHGRVSVDTLFPVDQLHHGGVVLTEKMAKLSGIGSGTKVLDAGSGIGGAARYLVDRFGCTVEAIDLSEEYVDTARELDKIVGLAGKIAHRAGSVTDLPFPDKSFHVVWSQNVTMNVPDKAAMFAQAFRVLRPGGVYVLSHMAETGQGQIDYPLPWAMSADTSFATSPYGMLQMLAEAGFDKVTDHAAGAPPPPPPPASAGQPQDMFAMGDDMPQRRANSGRAVENGRLVPMLVTACR
jgi:2-polyprenyl-3-methyl-5-hydroxy-6-metoxy-1,4-benzoquinol methylase